MNPELASLLVIALGTTGMLVAAVILAIKIKPMVCRRFSALDESDRLLSERLDVLERKDADQP